MIIKLKIISDFTIKCNKVSGQTIRKQLAKMNDGPYFFFVPRDWCVRLCNYRSWSNIKPAWVAMAPPILCPGVLSNNNKRHLSIRHRFLPAPLNFLVRRAQVVFVPPENLATVLCPSTAFLVRRAQVVFVPPENLVTVLCLSPAFFSQAGPNGLRAAWQKTDLSRT